MRLVPAFVETSSEIDRAVVFLNHCSLGIDLELRTAQFLDVDDVWVLEVCKVHDHQFFCRWKVSAEYLGWSVEVEEVFATDD